MIHGLMRFPCSDINAATWTLRPWWRHQMETFSALLAICVGNSPVPGEFPAQRPVTRSFDVFFDLRLNKRLSKQSWSWYFETLSCPLWHQCNESLFYFTYSTEYVVSKSSYGTSSVVDYIFSLITIAECSVCSVDVCQHTILIKIWCAWL